jgi:hypothetical protein
MIDPSNHGELQKEIHTEDHLKALIPFGWFMVFNTTFNNRSWTLFVWFLFPFVIHHGCLGQLCFLIGWNFKSWCSGFWEKYWNIKS